MNSLDNSVYTAQSVLSAQTAASMTLDAQRASVQPYFGSTLDASSQDAKKAAKQIESVFLNELMRIMMEHTSFGQDRTVSTYLPAITSELSKSLAEKGVGLGEFFLKGNGLKTIDQKPGGLTNKNNRISESGETG